MSIVSIFQNKTIEDFSFYCTSIKYIKNKGIILIGNKDGIIYFYRSDNYELIQIIQNENSNIRGFIQLNNGDIVSYAYDKSFKI